MNRREQYRRYLRSPEWRDLGNVALARTDGFCQFCGEFASQVHHVRYPKQFGEEHPHSLIPACERCHKLSHGIQQMQSLTNVIRMSDNSPAGTNLKYLVSEGRVFASAQSWMRALRVPEKMKNWFEKRLHIQAMLKKDFSGGLLEASYQDIPVYRWHAVAETLRVFDREYNVKPGHKHDLGYFPPTAQREVDDFYNRYERLVAWGHDLQERAMLGALRKGEDRGTVTEEKLVAAIAKAVAPRLHQHDAKLQEHDAVITEIREAVPTLQAPSKFITVKQAIAERGMDASDMPLYPNSKETLSGIVGQMLKNKGAEQGPSRICRLDGQERAVEMNTYNRGEIYSALSEIESRKQAALPLRDRN